MPNIVQMFGFLNIHAYISKWTVEILNIIGY